MSRTILHATAAALATAALAGCTGHSDGLGTQPPTSPPSDTRPITDTAPYLCGLVPEHAFRQATGLTLPLQAHGSGAPKEDYVCLAHGANREPPLGVHWSFYRGDKVLQNKEQANAQFSPQKLPAELGRGFAISYVTAGGIDRPNYAIALFRCGKQRPWLSIDIAPILKNRNAMRDMTDFIRIAEQRFSEFHKCKLAPL